MKVCHSCSNNLQEETITTESIWGDKRILVHNVSAMVCECGEQLFEAKVASRLQHIASNFGKTSEVPEYYFII